MFSLFLIQEIAKNMHMLQSRAKLTFSKIHDNFLNTRLRNFCLQPWLENSPVALLLTVQLKCFCFLLKQTRSEGICWNDPAWIEHTKECFSVLTAEPPRPNSCDVLLALTICPLLTFFTVATVLSLIVSTGESLPNNHSGITCWLCTFFLVAMFLTLVIRVHKTTRHMMWADKYAIPAVS